MLKLEQVQEQHRIRYMCDERPPSFQANLCHIHVRVSVIDLHNAQVVSCTDRETVEQKRQVLGRGSRENINEVKADRRTMQPA